MSTSLYWRPCKNHGILSDSLKSILRDNWEMPTIVNHSHYDFFTGLKAAGVEDADTVLDLISKHDEIELIIED